MPIKPENKRLYPLDWKQIRRDILERAGDKCEFCGVKNHAMGFRDADGNFNKLNTSNYGDAEYPTGNGIYIVLTIAHLDHDPTNNDPANLRALCQRCHNRYDAKHRQANARKTRRARKADRELF